MNTNAGKQRKGRQAPNKRGRQFDKSIMCEGVYSNPRLIHSTLMLVGCNVQVTVKNGGIYEGIFKTVSPSSQIVLELAHKVDPVTSGQSMVPTKQMLINSIIFNLTDVVTITAPSVDMDFANKDSFTDTAISKFNNGGGSMEKELQPWDADGGIESCLESLEKPMQSSASSANGWDAEDMFNVNAEKFKVESSYDPNLSQYTTPLVRKDTKEYREKEAKAARLAHEIEKTEDYGKRMDLENGDGDDEEMIFSAVHRPGEANNNSSGVGKYVPPHQRKSQPRPNRIVTTQGGAGSDSQTPSPQQPSPSRIVSGPALVPHNQRSAHQGAAGSVTVSVSVSSNDPVSEEINENKNKDDRRLSDLPEKGKIPERTTPTHQVQQMSVENRKVPNPKPRDKIQELVDFQNQFKLQESSGTKGVSQERKLSQPSQMPHTVPQGAGMVQSHQPGLGQQVHQLPQQTSEQTRQGGPANPSDGAGQPHHSGPSDKPNTAAQANVAAAAMDKKDEDKKDSDDDKEKKYTLNPNAKEFTLNPNAKEFVPYKSRQPMPISTPPRAATQSPVVNIPVGPAGPSMYPYIIQQHNPHTPYAPQAAMIPNAQSHSQRINAKRVVVSARPDLTAATATGQPLLQTPLAAQNTPYTVHQYNVQLAANAAQQGALQQVFHQGMVQMPGNARMINHSLVQAATTPTDQVAFQQSPQPHVFVPPQAHNMSAMQSYMGGPPPSAGAAAGSGQVPPSHTIPAHMQPHPHATPPHSQTNSHIPSQGGASGGHANPSPVPQTGQASHPHQQGHPPSSGTPQPVIPVYHGNQGGNPQQPGHPPLQPSPHTPTSPQAIYQQPAMPYSYASQSFSVQPVTYASSNHTTVTHAHHQHSHIPSQVLMMTHPQHNPHHGAHNAGINHQQLQHNLAAAAAATGGPPQANQFQINHSGQPHPQPHPVQGGPPIHGQAGPGHPLSVSMIQHPQMAPQPYHHNQ